MTLRLLSSLLLAGAITASPAGANEIRVCLSDRGIQEADLGAHVGASDYVENWFFLAALADGSYLYVTLFLTDVGIGLRPGVEFSLMATDGTRQSAKLEFDDDDVKIGNGAFDLAIGPNHVWGGTQAQQIHLKHGAFEADLRFQNTTAPWRPKNGRLCFDPKGKRSHSFFVANPRARVSGTIRDAGGLRQVGGWGYHDHTLARISAHKFSRRWFNVHVFQDDLAVHAMEFEADRSHGGARLGWFAAFNDAGTVIDEEAFDAAFADPMLDKASSYKIPRRAEVTASGATVSVARSVLLERMDVLSNLNYFTRKLIYALIAKPVYFRFRANCDVTVLKAKFTGPCVQETVMVQE